MPAVTGSLTAPSSNLCSPLTLIISRELRRSFLELPQGSISPRRDTAGYGSTALRRCGAGSGSRARQRLWLSSGTGVESGSDREGLRPIPVRMRPVSAEEKQLRATCETVRASLPLGRCRSLVRPRIALRAAGMGMASMQVQEPRFPPYPPIPPLLPGDLLAGFRPANQTAAPGANSPEECFDRALSSRRRERITSPNAGAPAACLVRDVTR